MAGSMYFSGSIGLLIGAARDNESGQEEKYISVSFQNQVIDLFVRQPLTSTLDATVRFEDRVHLEEANAASIATLRLFGHRFALLAEEARFVHLALYRKKIKTET